MNRVQAADSVGRAMRGILSRCQQRIGGWVGSSVIHLGDHNVPNALLFIDKYTQVDLLLSTSIAHDRQVHPDRPVVGSRPRNRKQLLLYAGGLGGSSGNQLWDHNVPNALLSIDKYTQVSPAV